MTVASHGTMSTLTVRPLVAALSGKPGALEAFFRATHLNETILGDVEARLSPDVFARVWEEALRCSGDPLLPIHLAAAIPVGAFGVVEYVCRAAPDFHSGLRQWARYLGILNDAVHHGFVESKGLGGLRILSASTPAAPASQEFGYAGFLRHARNVLGDDLRAARVAFVHQADQAKRDAFSAYFRTDVRFGAAHTEMLFDPAVLATPLPTADLQLGAILEPLATAQLERTARQTPTLAEKVRSALQAGLPSADIQLETIGAGLGMTGRSLQRRLKEEGASFNDIRDELRLELADRYLAQHLSFAEISFVLGFSERSAFSRAFKRWSGTTPQQRRAALRLKTAK